MIRQAEREVVLAKMKEKAKKWRIGTVKNEILPYVTMNALLKDENTVKGASIEVMIARYNELIGYYKIFDPESKKSPVTQFKDELEASTRLLGMELQILQIVYDFMMA